MEFQRSRNSVYNIAYHIVWCVKYRKPLLTGKVAEHLKGLLYQVAGDNGFTVETMEIMPDHVHLFVRATPSHLAASMARALKGVTARFFFREFPELKEELWDGQSHKHFPEVFAVRESLYRAIHSGEGEREEAGQVHGVQKGKRRERGLFSHGEHL